MALGPGQFDELATFCREATLAEAVVLVLGGTPYGPGFSCQCAAQTPELARDAYRRLVTALRDVADQIERDLGNPAWPGSAG